MPAGEGWFFYERCPGVRWQAGRFQRNWPLVEHRHCREKFRNTDVHYIYDPIGLNKEDRACHDDR